MSTAASSARDKGQEKLDEMPTLAELENVGFVCDGKSGLFDDILKHESWNTEVQGGVLSLLSQNADGVPYDRSETDEPNLRVGCFR